MGKVKKGNVKTATSVVVNKKGGKIQKPKSAAKKTVKEKIRKSLGLKSPKKPDQNKLEDAIKNAKSVKSADQSPNASPDRKQKKRNRNKKRKQSEGETEGSPVPGAYVLNPRLQSTKKQKSVNAKVQNEMKGEDIKIKKELIEEQKVDIDEQNDSNEKIITEENVEQSAYDELEKKFNIDEKFVRSGFEGLQKLLEQPDESNKLFEDEQPIFLQISSVKIPDCKDRIIRLPLKYSLYSDSSDICLITADIREIPYKETERVVDHYQTLLNSAGVTNIKTILPMYQLKNEYSEFEMKRKLEALYDLFLVEGKIAGKVSHFLGKIFHLKRKVPFPVRLDKHNLKESIENVLRKTPFHLHAKGDSFIIQIAHSKMDSDAKIANFWSAVEGLAKEFPGGWGNIRNLHLKCAKTESIPVYVSLSKYWINDQHFIVAFILCNFAESKNTVKTPVIAPKRPKAYKNITDELSTVMSKVTVTPEGDVFFGKHAKDKKKDQKFVKKGIQKKVVVKNKHAGKIPFQKNKQKKMKAKGSRK